MIWLLFLPEKKLSSNLQNLGQLLLKTFFIWRLIQVVKTTYSVFKRTSQRTDDYLIQKLVVKVSRNLLAMKPNLFAALLDHNQSATSNHISKMIKQISALAFSIFFNNYCKLRNQEGEKIRKRLSKRSFCSKINKFFYSLSIFVYL